MKTIAWILGVLLFISGLIWVINYVIKSTPGCDYYLKDNVIVEKYYQPDISSRTGAVGTPWSFRYVLDDRTILTTQNAYIVGEKVQQRLVSDNFCRFN